jgi:hypothetical protein
VDNKAAAASARELIDDIEAELLAKGATLEMLEQLAYARKVQAQIEAKMGVEGLRDVVPGLRVRLR